MICKKCGAQLNENAQFCTKCGCKIKIKKTNYKEENNSAKKKGDIFITGFDCCLNINFGMYFIVLG